jgi:hypothetical protein
MKKGADSGKTFNVDQIQSSVSHATCVSFSTLKRILKENPQERPKRKIKTYID